MLCVSRGAAQRLVDTRSLCYCRGMAVNSEQEAANANLARAKHRARGLYEKAEQSLTDTTLPENVRDAAHATKNFAALAVLALSSGRVADGNAMQSFAVEAWGEAKRLTLLPAAEYGQSFIDGPKKPRRDALARLIDDALAALPPRATAKQVLAKCEKIDGGNVIQEIDRDDPDNPAIRWRARGGREKDTSFKAFQNRLTK